MPILSWDESQCDECGDIFPEEDAVYMMDGRTLCEGCADMEKTHGNS